MNRKWDRLLYVLGILVGSYFAIFGYFGTQNACFCPVGAACSCPRPLSAYLFAIVGGTIAVASAIALILTFVKSKAYHPKWSAELNPPKTKQNRFSVRKHYKIA